MAFCTQRKFPGQSYENSGLAEINKMKVYSSIRDHRAWSIDQQQQASYLVDAVHKDDGDIVDLQRTMALGLSRCKNNIKKFSKRVGTADIDQHSSAVSQSDSVQLIELSMELEETRLRNSTLKNENSNLRKRIASIMASDNEHEREDNAQNHLQILEKIIEERNDLKDLLDKFLTVTDQIVEMKMQADLMKSMENDYILLQGKCRDQEEELEMLRSERKMFEERIRELETTRTETNTLKESNSKLEKDLVDLSNVISVSDSFIHDQDLEIKTKLHTISELNQQIDNLKMALSEAEMKLNKKLRLEMDVELMEKELSMMIENSTESNPYTQQVVDRQVEDLATAIKLTLGCMNYEFENNEEDNLVEANRQLKALLLESSNKILEFKDVINKQEQNLMKVTNDFACKNEELTECLATVEELKRHLANYEDVRVVNIDSPNVRTAVLPGTDHSATVAMEEEHEIFENEINLAESPQMSDYEDDGPEIEVLENIFEKSCSQDADKVSSRLRELKQSTRQSEELKMFKKLKTESITATKLDVANSGGDNLAIKTGSSSAEQLRNLSEKIERMSSYINDLESQNNKLKSQIRETFSDQEKLIGKSHLSNIMKVDRGGEKTDPESPSGSADEATNKQKAKDNATNSKEDISAVPTTANDNQYKNDERDGIHDIQKTYADFTDASSGTEDKTTKKQLTIESKEKLAIDFNDLISKNEELRNANEQLLLKVSCLEQDALSVNKSMSQMQRGRLSTKSQQFECDLLSDDVKKIENENLNLKLENEKLVVEIGKLKNLGNSSHLNVMEMKKELEKLTAINEQLSAELAAKNLEKDLLLAKEVESMPPDIRDLVLKNEELRKENENLLNKIRLLEAANSPDRLNITADETDWVPSNEDLVAEIEKLQQSNNKSNLTIRQMEKDLKRMELANENLSVRLSDKQAELNELSASPDIANILQQNEELKMLNRNLTVEINELKNTENVDADMKEQMEVLLNVNKTLQTEINELKQTLNTSMKADQQLKSIDHDLLATEPVSTEYNSNILKIGEDLQRIAALSEGLLALNDADAGNVYSLLDDMTPDINQLLTKNQELKLANENLTTKVRELQDSENRAHSDAIETTNRLEMLAAANELLQTRITEMESWSSNDRTTNLPSLKNENENLKKTNAQLNDQIVLLEKKLHNIENRTAKYLNEQQESSLSKGESMSMSTNDELNLEIDWMVADMKKLQSRNETLRSTNEKLLSQISELQACINRSNINDEMKNVPDKLLDTKESDPQLIYACNRNIEMEWMKSDMDALYKKNERLKSTNEGLVAEIGALKTVETQAQRNIQQMEKDLLRLSAMNERLTTQLNEKRLDKKHLLKVRSQELETKDLLKKIDELTTSNERLASEVTELKGLDSVKMRNDLKRLSSTNNSLKMQIAEMSLMSSNELKMESNWMAADMKKLLSKNKKLNISNQNLLNELNEMRKEFKTLENRANVTALQKVKEIDRLTGLNENLKDQLNAVNNERSNCHCNDIGPNCSVTDMRKVHKKNEELKAANEKLLSVIINLKNAEKQAISKATEMESELYKLRETNKSLQDTLENYVEKDWSRPKTELERICQAILNDGVHSLNNAEQNYMQNWFGKPTATDYDITKTARKNTTRKHCKVCHNSVDAFGKVCDCKHYEEKKRLNLLKEIEETKLAIQHIQKSNDIEFDLNDVRNRLLKGKPSDSSDDPGVSVAGKRQRQSPYYYEMRETQSSTSQIAGDMKKLQSRNETLRSTNEKLLSQISELQACINRSNINDEMKNVPDKLLDTKESDPQLIYACNRNIEMEWMKSDMDALYKKNERLKSTNEGLVAEIGALKTVETQAQRNIQQMEKDLLRLSAMNERLTTQLNEKRLDKKHLLKVRSQELETKDLLKKIDELTTSNERLASEVTELKGLDSVKMRNDLKRLSSTNNSLKMQIAEMSLMSSNELKMESNWMAADMKKLLSKNKKLNISNQNLLNELNEMRKEFKTLENRANVTALQKVKEIDRLTGLNENLKDQLNAVNNERSNCHCNDIGPNCSVTDMRKVHKKNEELKAANEKLLSVIINLKNAEKQAISKATEMESELYKLRETNKSLQDTLENYVEKDWSRPKTELERICQAILNDGVHSLNNAEQNYMQNWFGKPTATDYDITKTARKNTTRKHCKVCHNSVDAFGKVCDCKHYEEKKRLNLLKEIEETKLAIQHIQKSNDIEFDLNDVRNRLLKGKPSDSSDDDGPYEVRASQSQGNVNVRAHIITKCVKRNHQPRK